MTTLTIKRLRFRKPMLAKNYESHQKNVVFPCYVQPKLDGIRCITDGQRFWSRNGKEFPKENTKHLQLPRFAYLIDGEFMAGDGMDFEDIVSFVKRAGHERSGEMHFHVFDVMSPEPYLQRKMRLRHLFEKHQMRIFDTQWWRVQSIKCDSHADICAAHKKYIAIGYEGTMIRNAMGLYVPKRTHDLLKWKPLKEGEFIVVAIKEAKGKDKGTPVFICTADGDVDNQASYFAARPMGTMKHRQWMWRSRKKLIGELLTVEYQNLTKYGIPRFPRAKALRDYE